MVVNKDYTNWHIAYYCYNSIIEIQDYSKYIYCIIYEENKYIDEIIKKLENLKLVSYQNPVQSADFYLICCNFDMTNYEKNILANSKIINVYQAYLSYELSKTAVNYIVDEYRENNNQYYENYIHKKDTLAADYIQYYIKNCYSINGRLKLFNKIEIETINRCNNTCSFCPVNHNNDIRPFKIMEDDTFSIIINQLAELQYKGAVGLFANNEPLLDKKLIDRCELARKKLPSAYLYIYTNGILLSERLLCQLLKHLDYIYIDNYNTKRALTTSLEPIHKYLVSNNIDPERISIHLRNQNEILSTRAGNAPNKHTPVDINSNCILPFSQMVIQPSGKIGLCSNDALGQVILGDVTKQSLKEIWYGDKYEKIRTLIKQGRKTLNICKTCDAIFTPLPFERIGNE